MGDIAIIAIGYLAGRFLYEKAIPYVWFLIDGYIEVSKWINKKPSKFDKYYD